MIYSQTGTFLNIVQTDDTLTNRNISKQIIIRQTGAKIQRNKKKQKNKDTKLQR